MKAVGIICEYNPFHNGHIYHINKVKELYPNHTLILVLSGNYTQRGIVSIINKWDKTNIALNHNIDLVVELPYVFATQSADIFAYGAISILNKLNVEAVVFGSENDDVDKLYKLADIQLHNKDYHKLVKKYLKEGINYPTSMSRALKDIAGITTTTPNDLLGLSYVKQIILHNNSMKAVTIKRTNDFHDNDTSNSIASASAIRNNLNKNLKNVVPSDTHKIIQKKTYKNDDYFTLLKYQINVNGVDINKFLTVDEGIENRIIKAINLSYSYSELIDNVKTKRYTYNKLTRMFTHILTGFTKEEANECRETTYIRVLGMNSSGRSYLSQIKKELDIPLITAINSIKDKKLNIELRSTFIYEKDKELILKEFSKKPIIK